jgi:hypothetical protein
MRLFPALMALAVFFTTTASRAETMTYRAPEGDTVLGVVEAPLAQLYDTIRGQGAPVATVREGQTFPLLVASDGWFQLVAQGETLWTSQKGIRVTAASLHRKDLAAGAKKDRFQNLVVAGLVGALVLVLVLIGVVLRRRGLQEVRRRWILLATRHEALEEVLVKAGWDIQKLPAGTRMGEFLPHVRPTVVIADQAVHSTDVSALEALNAAVASTPVLWLDATIVSRAQDPLRAYLPPGSKVSAILEAVQKLSAVVPGPDQLSRRAEIEGKLGAGRLLELLHFLATARRTGRVEVRVGTESGWMWFEDGQLRHGLASSRSGIEAVYHCLDMTKGSFSFRAGVSPPEKSIRESTLTLLHEYARQHDEHAKIPGH